MQSFNELLIEEIEKHEILYNVAHRKYRNVQKKEKIWQKIAKTCDATADECKKRWKGLRDTYKKRKRDAMVKAGSQRKKWKYMDQMSFLERVLVIRETVGSVTTDDVLDEDSISNFSASPSFVQSAHSCFVKDDSASSSQRKSPLKKQANGEVKAVFQKMKQECAGRVEEVAATPAERDSTSLLFESLAKKITDSQLSRAALLHIEYKVMSVVYEELAKFEDNS